jgi:lactate permease
MIRTTPTSPAFAIGTILSDWFGGGFIVICPLLWALGAFFSGSTTLSNLTFGDIQLLAAQAIGTSTTAMLALQTVGASAGNGICLNNTIAACTVGGLTDVGEGAILLRTWKIVFSMTSIATIVMCAFFRF